MTCKLTVNLCSIEVELISVSTLGEMLHVAIRKRESSQYLNYVKSSVRSTKRIFHRLR